VRELGEPETSSEEVEPAGPLCLVEEVGSVNGVYPRPIQVPMSVDEVKLCMELDIGAAVSLISEKQCKQL